MCLLLISPLPPPPQTRIFDPEMLYSVKSGVSFSHVHCDLRTRLSHVYNLTWQRGYDNRFSTWLFLYFSLRLFVCILYQLLLFLLWRCFEKNRSDVKWIPFFMFSRILMQINAKEFSENSWETLGFSRTILLGNLARSTEYKQHRKQKQRQQKGDEKRTRYEVTKIAPSASAFSQERYLNFWGRGESNIICLSPRKSHPFKLDKLTTSHPFSPNLYHHLVTHPVPPVFC